MTQKILKSIRLMVALLVLSVAAGCASQDCIKIPYDMDFSNDYDPITLDVSGKSEFKILQLADIQLSVAGDAKMKASFELIEALVKNSQPDLIVLTGDNSAGNDGKKVLEAKIPFLDSLNVPYAAVFGNHDAEGGAREELAEYYINGKNCLFKVGPTNIEGVGNYVVNLVQDEKIAYSLYMLDSNRYRNYSLKDKINSYWKAKGNYDYIYPNQIAWYAYNVRKINELNGSLVNSLAFFHIAVPEFRAYKKAAAEDIIIPQEKGGEPVCNPWINTGFFDVMKELGSTKGAFVGHDHINNYVFKYQGIILGYGLKTGTGSYHDKDLQGGTLITLKNNFKNIEVKHLYEKDLK
ncbi:MAG: metallophosphoesterase [Spirochaetales bacterium]|nr:metallophosphoesterase [Spirochaetales bacterium]